MKKPQLLRQHLVAAIPALTSDPDKLLIFVDSGGLAGTYRPGLAFEYRYT
ncbi:TPA: phage tail protein, partial [Stenotrophomonas maltophilia]|nr:phage tail protein [Stenotrophomonas maltophilia]HDS1390209.1 phage tail protein [Stenotrophomonas maltophilia]HDS1432409.1 phage tail protein [Stenotrophomonas maltophilia]HDS1470339.1 phage tail protein [Stenotrophomonas maltophilia]HDS1484505.1 phage tail protein [Stenotrophomonas maltophilia]